MTYERVNVIVGVQKIIVSYRKQWHTEREILEISYFNLEIVDVLQDVTNGNYEKTAAFIFNQLTLYVDFHILRELICDWEIRMIDNLNHFVVQSLLCC